jgi:hypothetical protein
VAVTGGPHPGSGSSGGPAPRAIRGSEQGAFGRDTVASGIALWTRPDLFQDGELPGGALVAAETQFGQSVGGPTILMIGWFAHQQQPAEAQEGTGALRSGSRGTEETCGHDVVSPPMVGHPTELFGSAVQHFDWPISREFLGRLSQQGHPLAVRIQEDDGQVRPSIGHHQARDPCAGAQVEHPAGRSFQGLEEVGGVGEVVIDGGGTEHPEALSAFEHRPEGG